MMAETEQETLRAEAKELCSRAGALTFLLVIYGVYRFFVSGASLDHKLYTFVPTTLGLLSIFGSTFYGMTVCERIELTLGVRLSKFAGLLPYLAGMYMVFFLGLYGFYTLLSDFSAATLVRCVIFTVLGYKALFLFWLATELDKDETATVHPAVHAAAFGSLGLIVYVILVALY